MRSQVTPELIEAVKSQYATRSAREIAEDFGVSTNVVYRVAKNTGAKKDPEWVLKQQIESVLKAGMKTRFQKGHVPWAAGKKIGVQPWMKNLFQKGNVPHNKLPIGSVLKFDNGYWYKKISDTAERQVETEAMVGRKKKGRWRACHYLLWEEHNPPLEDGYVLVFKDGNTDNLVIENLEKVRYEDRSCWSKYAVLGQETFETISAIHALKREIRKHENDK